MGSSLADVCTAQRGREQHTKIHVVIGALGLHPGSDTSQGSLAVSPPRPVSFWFKWPHCTRYWGLRSFLENSGCFWKVGELCTCWQSLGMLNFHQSHQDFALSQSGNKCKPSVK